MAEIAVRVENLGKRYRIGHLEATKNLRDVVQDFLLSPMKRARSALRPVPEEELIWALRGLDFELEVGSVLGVIGRNGAGKSTLLKILSRITYPTEGSADVYGRLGSLLEVGTGFHQELTGRDNIYLNGAILGMTRQEIRRKFDEIVDFAGTERFLDTAVKRYSSGMYMRLAFAVAAHLETDILIVDEVLSVGDAEFQRKCLGKMHEVTTEGRTVIFVSHNMGAIGELCDRALLLEKGRLEDDGKAEAVVANYLSRHPKADEGGAIPEEAYRIGTSQARVTSVELLNSDRRSVEAIHLGEPMRVVMTLDADKAVEDVVFEVGISTLEGARVTSSFSTDGGGPASTLEPGRSEVALDLEVTLLPGHYSLDVGVHDAKRGGYTIDLVERILDFEVLDGAREGGDRWIGGPIRGYVRPTGRWEAPEQLPPAEQRVEAPSRG